NYVHITLDEGAVIATSKFEGTEKRIIRIASKYQSGRFDDDRWHTVTVVRTITLMTLSVDGINDEIRQYAPEIDWLVNSFSYFGGIAKEKLVPGIKVKNFRGCLKNVTFSNFIYLAKFTISEMTTDGSIFAKSVFKLEFIRYEADAYLINFITLANQAYGKSVIRSAGDLSLSCRKVAVSEDTLSFNSGKHFITLPKWNSMASGSLNDMLISGFQLRTQERDGLILFHGSFPSAVTGHDYIAFELIDGHLFMIINLGSGHIRLQTTAEKITDGSAWHTVTLERVGRTGTVTVDNIKTDFSTPGVSANFIVEEPIYLGAVPWPANETHSVDFYVPHSIWSANLRKGFVGCLKNIRINGISPNTAIIFQEQQKSLENGKLA
ncbi:unnamed protein product, partial [Thelazia callipaeda]|uniref:LAM_G_DOMAIN domain-containing protein n=1 Tax=Thelazia callipaeda TaxID=103827 RepID=A0A0N5CRR7_THECL